MARRDHTLELFALALLLAVFAVLFFVMSVHTYCEDRLVVAAVAIAAMANLYLLVRCWPRVIWRRGIAVFALLLCLFVIGFNGWSFVWATRTCAEQETQSTR
jgi:hypothetical protein